MPRDPRDISRLWDMLDAARTAVEFTKDLRFEEFMLDRKTRNAVERNLEILGEAARHVSPGTREQLPNVAWRSVIGFRNVLAHEYGEIRYEILWSMVRGKMIPLIRQLEEFGVGNPPMG
ncbi:MAG: DUF86 domain-containing protein [Candidatus Hydrogenedentes bacterium]|nr:DUF86 domain-containing protein [Candidatus Hydrogenedentota bacterium]